MNSEWMRLYSSAFQNIVFFGWNGGFMKHSREEIIEALTVIKETCDESNCVSCPLRGEGDSCEIQSNVPPSRWKIAAPDSCWMAFNE